MRAALSLLAIGSFVILSINGPQWAGGGESDSSSLPPTDLFLPTPEMKDSSQFVINGLPFRIQERNLSQCGNKPWTPLEAGGCRQGCLELGRQESAQGSILVWAEGYDAGLEAQASLHAAMRRCDSESGRGTLTHLWTLPGADWSRAGLGQTDPGQPVGPVELLPGARVLTQMEANGWSVRVDQVQFPHLAPEQCSLRMIENGWRRLAPAMTVEVPDPDLREAQIWDRAGHICIVSFRAEGESTLQVSACNLEKEAGS